MKNRRVGSFIKIERLKKNMSQVELAKKLGMKSVQQLSNIESGFAPFPLKLLKKLKHSLELTDESIINVYLRETSLEIKYRLGLIRSK